MTSSNHQQALIDAMRTALLADADLAGLVGTRIYDTPPARAVLPEITMRLVTAADRSSANTEAQLLSFDLDVWDRYTAGASLSRPRLIMAHIGRILHLANLTVAGGDLIVIRSAASRGPFREADNMTVHGIVSMQALVGHATILA